MLIKKNLRSIFQGETAVFIDAANLEHSVTDLGTRTPKIKRIPKGYKWKAFPKGYWRVDYKKLYRFFAKNSFLTSISFYTARFDTKSHDNFLSFLKYVGYRFLSREIATLHIC